MDQGQNERPPKSPEIELRAFRKQVTKCNRFPGNGWSDVSPARTFTHELAAEKRCVFDTIFFEIKKEWK